MPPLIGTTGAASARGFGLFASTGDNGFIAFSPYSGGNADAVGPVALSSSGAVMFSSLAESAGCGITYGNLNNLTSSGVQTGANKFTYNSNQNFDNRSFTYRPSTDVAYFLKHPSTDKVYVGTITSASSAPAAGSTLEQTVSGGGWSQVTFNPEVQIDSSGNFYTVGTSLRLSSCIPYYRPVVVKGTMSGLTFVRGQITFSASGADFFPAGCRLFSSTSLVTVGSYGNNNVFFFLTNLSTGVVSSQLQYTGIPATQAAFMAMDVDTATNSTYVFSTSGSNYYLSKFSSTGGNQFRVQITGGSSFGSATVKVGPGNFVYLYAAITNTSSQSEFVVFKFNSSGVLQWQRALKPSSTSGLMYGTPNYVGNTVAFSSDGFMYIGGRAQLPGNGFSTAILWKYPTSGSVTGTYTVPSSPSQAMTIYASSYTVTDLGTTTSSAASITYGNATLGSAITTNTITVTPIGGRTTVKVST